MNPTSISEMISESEVVPESMSETGSESETVSESISETHFRNSTWISAVLDTDPRRALSGPRRWIQRRRAGFAEIGLFRKLFRMAFRKCFRIRFPPFGNTFGFYSRVADSADFHSGWIADFDSVLPEGFGSFHGEQVTEPCQVIAWAGSQPWVWRS
jgi:hypothetical protein